MSRRRDWTWWWLIAVLALAFAVRAVALEAQSLWRDEVDALHFATAPWPEMLDRFTRPGWNGPFYFLMLRGWIALTGRSVFALRYLSTLWGVVGIALFYILGRRLLGRTTASWSVVLAAFSPYLVWYAQEVKMYTWVPALVLLTLYALERASRGGHGAWLGVACVSTLLALYSHILAALLMPVGGIWFLLRRRRRKRNQRSLWVLALLALVLLVIFYRPLLRWQLPLVFQERETGYASRTFGEMAQILLGGWSAGIAGWGQVWLTLGTTAVALVGLIGLLARRWITLLLAFLAWLVGPLVGVWLVSLRGSIFTDRYLIWSAPAFYLLVGFGLDQFRRLGVVLGAASGRLTRRLALGVHLLLLVLLLGILSGDGVNLYQQVARPIKPQFREATGYLLTRRAPGALLLFQIPYNHIVVDYYAPTPLDPWAEAPYTNWRDDEGDYLIGAPEVAEQMRALTAGYTDVWLVYTEVALWDDRELVLVWLQAHGELVDKRHFHLVDLYHFRLPEAGS
ncbi:MAG: glycosyltransferase family 39 protein [Anaerolineae bacterium]